MSPKNNIQVLFVCTGNTCRSPMAEHLFRHMLKKNGKGHVVVKSAGVSPATWLDFPKEAREVLKGEGITEIEHEAKPVTNDLMEESALVLAMEQHHKEQLEMEYPDKKDRVHLVKELADPSQKDLGISDPYGQGIDAYRVAFGEIKQALQKILNKIPEE